MVQKNKLMKTDRDGIFKKYWYNNWRYIHIVEYNINKILT